MLPAFRGLQSKVVEKLVVIHLLVGLLCVVFVQHFGEEEPEHTKKKTKTKKNKKKNE